MATYKIVDSRTDEWVYIGSTRDKVERQKWHRWQRRTPFNKWAKDNNMWPHLVFTILEEVPQNEMSVEEWKIELVRRECEWKQRHPTKFGIMDGLKYADPEIRKARQKAQRAGYNKKQLARIKADPVRRERRKAQARENYRIKLQNKEWADARRNRRIAYYNEKKQDPEWWKKEQDRKAVYHAKMKELRTT
jgi:hypothetical protein